MGGEDMPTDFQRAYTDAVFTSQKLKLEKNPMFPEAVANIYQLLGTGEGPEIIKKAYRASKKKYEDFEASKKVNKEKIKLEAKQTPANYREFIEKSREAADLWEHADRFLTFLVGLGHLYGFIELEARREQVGSGGPVGYGGELAT